MAEKTSLPAVRTRTRSQDVQPVATEVAQPIKIDPLAKGTDLANVLADAAKRFGSNTLFRASTRPTFKFVPTGIFAFDYATKGGIPLGLTTGFIGQKHSGKSTMTLRVIAAFQRMFPHLACVLIDIEGSYDPIWGALHGIDNERLVLCQPSSGEQACDLADAVLRAEQTCLVVVDSLAGLMPLKEIEASLEDNMMGKNAQMITRFCRKTQQALLDERKKGHMPAVVLINQYSMSMSQYGSPFTERGGQAPGYLYSMQYQLRSKEVFVDTKLSHDPLKADMGIASHNEVTFTKKKNKLMNGLDETQTIMIRNPYHPLGAGFFDEAKTVLTEAKKLGIISERPPYAVRGVEGKFAGVDDLIAYCYSDLDFYEAFQLGVIDTARAAQGLEAEMKWLAN